MPKLKTAAHIKTNRNRKSFRACNNSTGEPQFHQDEANLLKAESELQHRQIRRLWMSAQTKNTNDCQ